MNKAAWKRSSALMVATITGLVALPDVARAQSPNDLRQQIETMQQQLQELKQQLETTQQKAEQAKQEATTEATRLIKWHLGGYATADYTRTNRSDTADSFGGGKFNPIFLVGYDDLLLFEGELEISTTTEGETDTQLEFATLNLLATDWLTFSAGKFLSPLGDFQQHLHPTWINKLPDRPAGFVEEGGTEHLSEVGVMARGAFPLGATTMDYAAFVGNGPQLAEDLEDGVELEGFGSDNNDNKAFGGRIGVRPLPYLSIGFSGMLSKVEGNDSGATDGDYDLEDVDAAFTMGSWDIRGEYIRAHLDSLSTGSPLEDIPATTWHAWYAQAAYRLAGLTDMPVVGNFEPVFRYSRLNAAGLSDFEENDEDRWTIGLDYWFAPSLVAKAAFESRDFKEKSDADEVRLQFAFGF